MASNSGMTLSFLQAMAYFCFCNAMHLLFSVYSERMIPNFNCMPKAAQISWYNRGVATMHSVVQFSLTAYYWIALNPGMEIAVGMSTYESFCLDVMMGYIVYDTINEMMTNQEKDTLLHHVMGFVSHLSTRWYNCGVATHITMLVFIAEMSTSFLHMSWLLHNLRLGHTVLFKVLVGIVMLTFFVSRIVTSPVLLYTTYHSYFVDEVLNAGWKANDAPPMFFYLNALIVIMFACLNCFWFYKLVNIAFAVGKGKKIE